MGLRICDCELEKITVPTLLLLGESGLLGSGMPSVMELVEGFKTHCKRSEVAIVKDAGGTYCMFEKPKETAEQVKAFLSNLPGA